VWKSLTLRFRPIRPVLRDWAPTFCPLDGTAKCSPQDRHLRSMFDECFDHENTHCRD
jgi:hypothetical protein